MAISQIAWKSDTGQIYDNELDARRDDLREWLMVNGGLDTDAARKVVKHITEECLRVISLHNILTDLSNADGWPVHAMDPTPSHPAEASLTVNVETRDQRPAISGNVGPAHDI